jgi:hypothetical protein
MNTTKEQLFECPRCGRKNFTARGLKAHVCKGAGRAPDGAKPAKKTSALALVNAPELAVKKDGVQKLQEIAVRQMAAIGEMETRAAMGAVIAGLTLHRVKASMPHGAFGRWVKTIRADETDRSAQSDRSAEGQIRTTGSFLKNTVRQIRTTGANLPPINHRQVNYYMKLALVFLEKAKVTKPDLLALPGDQLTLDLADTHEATQFLGKLHAFTGGRSLNELLIKYDIKSVGLKKELDAEKDAEEPPAALDAGQLYEQARDEIGGAILRLENLLLTENRLQFLVGHDTDLLGIVKSVEALAKKVSKAAKPLLEAAENPNSQNPNSKRTPAR